MFKRWPPALNAKVQYYNNDSKCFCLCKIIRIENNTFTLQTLKNPKIIYSENSLQNVFLYGRWNKFEKKKALLYYYLYGNNWKTISHECLKWRTPSQIRSHMQKILKNEKGLKILSQIEKYAIVGLVQLSNNN